MREEYYQTVFSSEPHEREQRENAYLRAKALDDLIATMNSFVAYYEEDVAQADED